MAVGVDKFHQVVAGVVDIRGDAVIGGGLADYPAPLVVVVVSGVARRVGDRNPVAVYIVGEAGGAGLFPGGGIGLAAQPATLVIGKRADKGGEDDPLDQIGAAGARRAGVAAEIVGCLQTRKLALFFRYFFFDGDAFSLTRGLLMGDPIFSLAFYCIV
jgi:hypothetical protein